MSGQEFAEARASEARKNEQTVTAARARQDDALLVSVQQRVKRSLRDPESAQFRAVKVMHSGDAATLCGEVNAKNGSWYTGFMVFIGDVDGVLIRNDDNASRFVKRWNSRCVTDWNR
jgi:hypothetical protein